VSEVTVISLMLLRGICDKSAILLQSAIWLLTLVTFGYRYVKCGMW